MDSNIVEDYGPAFSEDPNILLLRKEAYYDLSQDAREVLRLIINAPEEFFELERNDRNSSYKNYVYDFLWNCKRRRFSKRYCDIPKRRKLVFNDFKMIREFLSLFNGVRIWR